RLVRMLCQECRQPADMHDLGRKRYGLEGVTTYKAVGCSLCRNTGYRGRIGIFEFLPITEQIVTAIYDRRSAEEIRRLAARPTLLDDGVRKVKAGTTTLDEVLRVTA